MSLMPSFSFGRSTVTQPVPFNVGSNSTPQNRNLSTLSVVDHPRPDPLQVVRDIRTGLLGMGAAKFSDVVLITADKQRLYACRALLAVRSPFFANLFFSDFAESANKEVSISIPGRPLNHILEFAYTAESSLVANVMACIPKSPQESGLFGAPPKITYDFTKPTPITGTPVSPRHLHRTEVTDLCELAASADYCDVVALRDWCMSTLNKLIRAVPVVACTALEALTFNPVDNNILSRQTLIEYVASNCESCMLVPDCTVTPTSRHFNIGDCTGVLELTAPTLEAVLKVKLTSSSFPSQTGRGALRSEYMFQVVYYWGSNGLFPVKCGSETDPKGKECRDHLWHIVANGKHNDPDFVKNTRALNIDSIVKDQQGERWQTAKQLIIHLDLSLMRSSFIHDYIEESGLFQTNMITNAYKRHAIRSQDYLTQNGFQFNENGGYDRSWTQQFQLNRV